MKILLADDHAIVRRGLRSLLEADLPDVQVVEAGTAQETLSTVRQQLFDIVVLDIHFQDGNGLDLVGQIQNIQAQARILVLSVFSEKHYARRAFKLGASGYLNKASADTELINAMHKLQAGGKYITPVLAESLADELSAGWDKAPHETLSGREFQIMSCLAQGLSVGEVAAQLSLSPKTVSTYRVRLLHKLDLRTTAELVRYALENRLIE